VDGAGPVAASAAPGPDGLLVTYAGQTRRYACARDGSRAAGSGASRGGVIWLGAGGHTWMVREEEALAVRRDQAGSADGTVRSPMPGTVQAVTVTEGQPVTAGQPLIIVEAMKMEHTVTAPLDGTVTELLVKGGQQVAMDETLAVVRAAGPAAPDGGPAPEGSADRAAPDEPSAP
jgi:acetyl-CoA/propionyl-CoA carboxylase biotin carboxyl carrier protein